MRRGMSLVEVLVGLFILGVGLLPVLNLMGGSRSALGQSKEMVRLEGVTFQALAHARALVLSGELADLGADEEEAVEFTEPGLTCRVLVSRVPGRPLFRLAARTALEDRYFAIACLVADPMAGVAATTTPMTPGGPP